MPFRPHRRAFVAGSALAFGATSFPGLVWGSAVKKGESRANELPEWFSDLERRTFNYFDELSDPETGLIPDRWPTPSFCSIAAVGFGLTAFVLGVERGWISREKAVGKVLKVLRFMSSLPSGPEERGKAGYRGFFYHFLDMKTGLRYENTELSTVDTAILHLGILHAVASFDRNTKDERELRRVGLDLVNRAEWDWFLKQRSAISMGWHPESGLIERNWDGYNEGKLVYILALGSDRHAVPDGSWFAWTETYSRFWRGQGETRRLAFAPMFGHQYSEMWIDFRGIYDEPMREAGFDYFENSRRETLAQHAYGAANPMGWSGYGNRVWGLTACDGPGDFRLRHEEHEAVYRGYSARGPIAEPDGFDDGTIAPTAMLGSLPFAPEICVPSAEELYRRHGPRIYDRYGFKDSFNPSFRYANVTSTHGSVDPEHGWVASDWLGIDQGPILGMLANYRNETIWRKMRTSPNIIKGLKRAGFTGGWLEKA